jgi:hypothetical protein
MYVLIIFTFPASFTEGNPVNIIFTQLHILFKEPVFIHYVAV